MPLAPFASLLLAATLLVGCQAGAAAPAPSSQANANTTPTNKTQVTAMNATRNQVFSVTLKSAGGGGYKWHLVEGYNRGIATFKGERVGESKGANGAIGVFADEIFDFTAVAPGATTLVFSQYRDWEGPAQAAETHRVTVTVQ